MTKATHINAAVWSEKTPYARKYTNTHHYNHQTINYFEHSKSYM